MAYHIKIGKIGERIAELYLKNKGYKIVNKNFYKKFGEIDLITIAPDRSLVFVEVKTLNKTNSAMNSEIKNESFLPEENLSSTKLYKLRKICSYYANKNSDLISEERGWRIDLLAIEIKNLPKINLLPFIFLLTNISKYCEIRHYENL